MDNIQAGQAEHLADWVEDHRVNRKAKAVRTLKNAWEKAGQLFDELFLYDTPKSQAMEKGLIILSLALASIITVVQMGIEKGWW